MNHVAVIVAPGHAGLTGCAIDYGLHQIAPMSGQEWFQGDDSKYEYDEHIIIHPENRELVLRGYNLDDTYAHTFIISFSILPEWVLIPGMMFEDAVKPITENTSLLNAFFKLPGL